MKIWKFKKNIYDLDKLTLQDYKGLTGKSDKDYYELTGKQKPEKISAVKADPIKIEAEKAEPIKIEPDKQEVEKPKNKK